MITVVGGGPAGRLAAVRLAGAGEEVILVDRRSATGGQCLHHGCMLVCALNDCARTIAQAGRLTSLGVLDSSPHLCLRALWEETGKIQTTIAQILDKETREAGVELLTGAEAVITEKGITIDGRSHPTDKILIATGSHPFVPDISGIDLPSVFTPYTIQTMQCLPKELIIVGGGVIAAEYAYIFSSFGVNVRILCRSGFLKEFDPVLQRAARRDLAQVTIHEGVLVEGISEDSASGLLNVQAGGNIFSADAVFLATGLVPNTSAIEGFARERHGGIAVDAAMRTSVPNIFAAGDVTGPPYLTPVARREGRIAADAILGQPVPVMPKYIPQCIKMGYDHAFCGRADALDEELVFPSPAGSGSFWSVPERFTGFSKITYDGTGAVTSAYAGAPGSSLFLAYVSHLMEHGSNMGSFEDFMEIHPSTDAIYGMIRYAEDLRSEKK